jgi:hypothetical protein
LWYGKKIENKLVTVENDILIIRGQKVLLDSDVAKVYGVETRVLKQAVRRNEKKFPDGYLFKLTQNEFNSLKINKTSQNVTSFGGVQYAPTEIFVRHVSIDCYNAIIIY